MHGSKMKELEAWVITKMPLFIGSYALPRPARLFLQTQGQTFRFGKPEERYREGKEREPPSPNWRGVCMGNEGLGSAIGKEGEGPSSSLSPSHASLLLWAKKPSLLASFILRVGFDNIPRETGGS